MADGKLDKGPLKTGSVVSVTVENSLPTVIIVSLKHGSKIFRGALVDATHTDGPLGIDITKKEILQANEPLRSPEVLLIDPNHEPGKPPQISSVALRHTYQLDPDAVDTKLLPPPPKPEFRKPASLRGRNVRNMRLRPRKVLCANCKQAINENKPNPVKNVVTRSSTKQANEKANNPDKAAEPTTASVESKPAPEPDPVPSRKAKKIEKTDDKKVPVLKLSLPKSSVSKASIIAPKTESVRGQENDDPEEITNSTLSHEEYRKQRKALKKAKLKQKQRLEKENPSADTVAENGHHKRKHGKHKMKRKHKHKDLDQENPKSEDTVENLKLKLSCSSQPKTEDAEFDSAGLSNAQEFTTIKNKTCSVRLTKMTFDQSKPQNDPNFPENENDSNYNPIEILDSPDMQTPSSPLSTDTHDNDNVRASVSTTYQVQVSDISDPEDDVVNSPAGSSHSYSNPGVSNPIATSSLSNSSTSYRMYNPSTSLLAPHPPPTQHYQRPVPFAHLGDGRVLQVGDVVWGKWEGAPFFPARILTLSEYCRDSVVVSLAANISWYGYKGTVDVSCYDLYPFLEFYDAHYSNTDDRFYQANVKQATKDAQAIASEKQKCGDASNYNSSDSEQGLDMESLDGMVDQDEDNNTRNYQDKENLDSVDTHNMLDYDDLKPIHNDNVTTTTPTQTPTHISIGKTDSLDDMDQFNNFGNFS